MKATQNERIVAYIRQFGSITPLQAVADIGCMRLASRINDLKRMGYRIRTEYITGTNRLGEKNEICPIFHSRGGKRTWHSIK